MTLRWFKSKPCWVKGGIIGVLIPLISFLLLLVFVAAGAGTSDYVWYLTWITIGVVYFIDLYLLPIRSMLAAFSMSIFFYFVFGALIGEIYGKVKKVK